MIVRDEAHVIADTLASVARFIDRYVIVDTGSTDRTAEVIRAFFQDAGIPGEIHERPWRDFGSNRSEALDLCRGLADYAWVIDADDLLLGEPDLGDLSLDSYDLRYGADFVYWRKQIFRLSLPWRYEGALHEYATCDLPFTSAQLSGAYHIESRRLGTRSNDPRKYERDAELLLAEVRKNPDDARATFYLAQSYFDAGNTAPALESYRRRTRLGGWDEETWYAAFRVGECLERLEGWPAALDAYLAAWQLRPSRAEPLYRIAVHYRTHGQYQLGYLFAKRASEIPLPAGDRLFVWAELYEWRIADELAVSAYHIGRHQESFDACMSILDSEEIPEGDRERVICNRDFAAVHIRDTNPRYPEEIVSTLSTARSDGDVTLTITTCRRFELFEKTIHSFLANCTDIGRIARWICIDDGSSADDRSRMRERYPFFEFIFKESTDKGHAGSMNRLLQLVQTRYWLHLEDDWQFFVPLPYVSRAIAIVEDEPSLAQALFNRNYAETLECRAIAGGVVQRTARERIRYRVHQHLTPGTTEYERLLATFPAGASSVAYWPHFSLRPSLMKTDAIKSVGAFNPEAVHFERDFADRYVSAGWRSAFFDGVHALHIGRLTYESPSGKPNAYDLNDHPQFLSPVRAPVLPDMHIRVINLDRRPDRWAAFQEQMRVAAGESVVRRCERFPAIDGTELEQTPELEALFAGNDFGWRRTFIGCAMSHIRLWEDAARQHEPTLIFEDDVRLAPDLLERLTDVRRRLGIGHPSFDICFLGYLSWSGGASEFSRDPQQLSPMRWDDYLGGLAAYVLSPHGARKLLQLVQRDGVQHGIDRFIHVHAPEVEALLTLPPLAIARLAVHGDGNDSDIQHDLEPLGSPHGRHPTRVKLMGNWCSPEELCRDWNRMSQGDFRWNDLEVTWEDRDVDFYVIVNVPRAEDRYLAARSIVLQMEPWCGSEEQTWGVKTWGEWSRPEPSRFLQVRAHRDHLNTPFWQLAATYSELRAMSVAKTKTLATICGGKYFDPGHKKRVDFLKYLEEKDDDVVRIDIYAHDNPHGFRWYAGPHPPGVKDAALLPYRYFFAAENNREHNFITEKLWEPLLTETLCFYWGAPNVAEHVDPRAFIALDLDDFEASFRTMRAAILDDEWSRRVDIIRAEKTRVLEQLQFFPMLERILRKELRLGLHPTDDDLFYGRYFGRDAAMPAQTVAFVHSFTRGGDESILREILETIEASGLLEKLDRLYVVNVGDALTLEPPAGKIRIVHFSDDPRLFEYPTLDLLHCFSAVHSDARILYVHTKGSSQPGLRTRMDDWRRFMLYHLAEQHETALAALESHDAAGCNLRWREKRHFSGNFWWANARYIRTLPKPGDSARHEAEWWVLSDPAVRPFSLGESGVDHYQQDYARALYATR